MLSLLPSNTLNLLVYLPFENLKGLKHQQKATMTDDVPTLLDATDAPKTTAIECKVEAISVLSCFGKIASVFLALSIMHPARWGHLEIGWIT